MKLLLPLLILCFCFSSIAQTPIKTRQSNWQQKVDYTITVKLDDVSHTLSAYEEIVYTNNSPNELKEIYLHLWPNAYKNDETSFAKQILENGKSEFYFSSEEDKGWIDSLNFKINGEKVKWSLLDSIDICKIEFTTPLKSGQKIVITTPFKVKIPKVFSRMGHEGQMYCISQWYPKPAVYDVNGWNYFPYLDQGEFYSEFGKFDVSITVPKNYVLAATGDLQNEEEKNWLFEKSKDKFVKTVKGEVVSLPTSSNEFKTLRFIQDNVHDFAWFCDKRFKVERSEVTLKSGRKITTWLYEVNPKNTGVYWVDTAINFYSRLLGEYPYNSATAVVTPLKAGGGMEYPTITNIENASREIIVHEVGHNWFYGILANNERVYPWMDESFNTYYENRNAYQKKVALHGGLGAALKKKSFSLGLDEGVFGMLQLEYYFTARKNNDQAVNIPSTDFTDLNYGTIIYAKAPLMFHHLQDYLGDSLFDAMMQSYYEIWKFKHPLPDDFFDHARKFTGKNLDWFYQLYSTTIKPDYKIVSAKNNQITIKNKANIASPFPVSTMIHDSVIETKWFEGFKGKSTFNFEEKKSGKYRIDAYETTLDLYRDNNTIRTHGILKSVEPIKFKLLGDLESPYKTQIFYSPIIGANLYNKTMLGVAFYNGLLPQKKFDYTLAPMYSFGTNEVVGYVNIERHFASSGYFNQIHLGVNGSRFAYGGYGNDVTYNKIEPFISFDFNKNNKRSTINQNLLFRTVLIINSNNKYTLGDPYQFPDNSIIEDVSYTHKNNRKINKNELVISLQNIKNNTDAIKTFAVFKQTVNYEKPKKKLDMRFFAGTFLYKQNATPGIGEYEFKTSGNTGQFDYMFDQALMGRSASEGLFAYQLIERDANMHMPINITSSNSWMMSTNLVTTIPGPIPIRLFADLAYTNTMNQQAIYTPTFQYVVGLKFVVAEDVFEINVPLFNSQDFEDFYQLNATNYKDENALQHIGRKITFTFNLNKLNPIKAVREFSIN